MGIDSVTHLNTAIRNLVLVSSALNCVLSYLIRTYRLDIDFLATIKNTGIEIAIIRRDLYPLESILP